MPPGDGGLWRRMLVVVVVARTPKSPGMVRKRKERRVGGGENGKKSGERKPQRTLTNCHLQCNTRSVRTIIQHDADIAGASENPYTERKMPGPRLN